MDLSPHRTCERRGQVSVPSPSWKVIKNNKVVPSMLNINTVTHQEQLLIVVRLNGPQGRSPFLTDRIKQKARHIRSQTVSPQKTC